MPVASDTGRAAPPPAAPAQAAAGPAGAPDSGSIALEGCTRRFGGQVALEPLSTRIEAGGVTGLVGPDGAGKTTLMRMLAGLLRADAGTIFVAGLDPIGQSRDLRAILGYMPQRFGLYEDLSVQENLDLYAALRGLDAAARAPSFERLLKFTGLGPFTGRLAGKLSGGMKQKLGLACTLLGSPRVLLLDEPGVGVDPISRRELWSMVHELAGAGMLILWSTSYLDEAEQCRDVILLNQGKLLFRGEPGKLTEAMRGRAFLAEAPPGRERAVLQQAIVLPEVGDGSIQGRYLRLILRRDAKPEAAALGLGLAPEALRPTAPRFEDAFIDLLGGGPSKKSELADILEQKKADPEERVIEAVELTKRFGDFTATDHVNFAVRRGEIFGLLGPNGAGKSTTFKMMCGLLKPTSGRALVLGLDLQKHPGRVRERLGYMAQKFSLYGGLSVRQNLEFFSGVYGLKRGARKERVEEMIATFNLKTMLALSADELPLGYKQRLALACALMHRPDILFLDEPTSGVDPLTRREFWLHINSLVDKGVTVMVTTHFMDEAEYCDRIGLVYHGRLIADGTPDSLKKRVESEELLNPSMEDAFIALIRDYDRRAGKEAAA